MNAVRWAIVYREPDGNYWFEYDQDKWHGPVEYPEPTLTTEDLDTSFKWFDAARFISHGEKDRLRIKRVKFTIKPKPTKE